MTSLAIRPLAPEDAEPLLRLAHRQGRNVHATEYPRFLRLEGATGLVLEREGDLVGAITAIRYFEHGFLGPPVVEHGPQAAGLALLLIGRAVEGLLRAGAAYVECEASPDDAPLLAPLGFERVRGTVVLERKPAQGRPSHTTVACEAEHLLDIGILDADTAGFGRKGYLDALRLEHPEGARVLLRHGEVEGYVLARRSRHGYHLGPLVTRAPAPEPAQDLLRDAVAALSAWPIVALAPERAPFVQTLREEGFAPVGSLERMRAGAKPPSPEGGTEWLLGGRITG